jgi:hypothetical protein
VAQKRRRRIALGDAGEYVTADGPWLFWYLPDGPDVRVKVTRVDQRLAIQALWVDASTAEQSLQATHLRSLALGKIEAVINDEEASAEIGLHVTGSSRFEPGHGTKAELHHRTKDLPIAGGAESLRLAIPPGRYRDDDFYIAVAKAFATAARTSRHPAQDLAEINVVPVTTVHRWMREARLREERRTFQKLGRMAKKSAGQPPPPGIKIAKMRWSPEDH